MSEQQKCEDPSYWYIQYENCSLYLNVLFYALSYIDFESVDESFDEILSLIEKCFQINYEESEKLKKLFLVSLKFLMIFQINFFHWKK